MTLERTRLTLPCEKAGRAQHANRELVAVTRFMKIGVSVVDAVLSSTTGFLPPNSDVSKRKLRPD
jgi:hypothetical protein